MQRAIAESWSRAGSGDGGLSIPPDGLDAVSELHTFDRLWQLVVAVEATPSQSPAGGSDRLSWRHGHGCETRDEAVDWLRFYNHRRLHSTLACLSPMAFEKKRLGDKDRFAA
jgi:transposase InsO family protein